MKFSVFIFALIFFYNMTPICAGSIKNVSIFSEAMQKSYHAILITPKIYDIDSTTRLPVLYLLHGYSGDYTGFAFRMTDLADLSDKHRFIIVCPDGGFNSWYYDSPIDPKCRFETYITKEVVAWVDKNFRTIPTKERRGIAGLSMGGHGALYLAIRHQNVFGAAGSMSGGLDLMPHPNEWELPTRLGTQEKNKTIWEKNTVINMINEIKKPFPMLIDCGIGDFFYPANVRFHEKLLKAKIPHIFISRPGEHNWDYWEIATRYQLLFFQQFFYGK